VSILGPLSVYQSELFCTSGGHERAESFYVFLLLKCYVFIYVLSLCVSWSVTKINNDREEDRWSTAVVGADYIECLYAVPYRQHRCNKGIRSSVAGLQQGMVIITTENSSNRAGISWVMPPDLDRQLASRPFPGFSNICRVSQDFFLLWMECNWIVDCYMLALPFWLHKANFSWGR